MYESQLQSVQVRLSTDTALNRDSPPLPLSLSYTHSFSYVSSEFSPPIRIQFTATQ